MDKLKVHIYKTYEKGALCKRKNVKKCVSLRCVFEAMHEERRTLFWQRNVNWCIKCLDKAKRIEQKVDLVPVECVYLDKSVREVFRDRPIFRTLQRIITKLWRYFSR